MYSLKRTIYPLIIPVMLIVLSSAIIIIWPNLIRQIINVKELRAILVIMPLMPYIVLALGFAMGWRYANAGMILGTLTLALSYYGLNFFQTPGLPREVIMHQSVSAALPFLLPLNLALFCALIKRRLFTSIGILIALLLAGQVLAVLVFCHPHGDIAMRVSTAIRSLSPLAADRLSDFSNWLGSALSDGSLFNFEISAAAAAASGLALLCVLGQFIKSKDIRTGGFFFAIVAALLGVVYKSSEPAIIFYFMAAGLILVITNIEASFVVVVLSVIVDS